MLGVALEVAPSPHLSTKIVSWSEPSGELARATIVARCTYAWDRKGITELATPRSVEDETPWKPHAEVSVVGAEQAHRTLYGVGVARGLDVLLGFRSRRASDFVTLSMQYVAGGEQILLMGFVDPSFILRLPSLTAHAVLENETGTRQLPLAGDRLVIDVARREASVTWRGVIDGRAPEDGAVKLTLTPIHDVEELLGTPPRWERAPRVRSADARQRIPLLNDTRLAAAAFCSALEPDSWQCTIVAKGTYDIAPGVPATLAEEPRLLTGDHADGTPSVLTACSDLVPFKPRVDVLVEADAHTKAGEGLALVSLSIGALSKEIVILGARRWQGGVLSEPAPFDTLPLCYRHAFGGDGVAENPAGTGTPGSPPPRIEHPDHLMRSPMDKPPPVGMTPIHPSWAPRAGLLGTADDVWADERWPALPADADVAFFNAAPRDQQCARLAGDEPFQLTSVLPGGEMLRGQLPGQAPSLSVRREDGTVTGLAPKLDTVIIDARRRQLALTWRASVSVRDEDASDVSAVQVAYPAVDEDEAWERFERHGDERFVVDVHAEPPDGPWVTVVATPRARRRARDASLIAPIVPPTREDVSRLVQSDGLAGQDLTGANLSGFDLRGKDLSDAILRGCALSDCQLDGANLRGATLAECRCDKATFVDADLTAADLTEAVLDDAVLDGAELERASLNESRLRRASLRNVRARGVQLKGSDLSQACLTGGDFESADLSGATLDGLDASGATLRSANLADCHGRGVILDEAILEDALLENASLEELSAKRISADHSVWEGAMLTGANYEDASLSHASFTGADLTDAMMLRVVARRARMEKAKLRGAKLSDADLMEARLDRADLRHATLTGANLYGVGLRGATLAGASLDGAIVAGTRLASASRRE